MSYDIYGNNLRRGHCEVHPHVHEEYPCSVCLSESRSRKKEGAYCDGNPARCESAHLLGVAQEEIDSLKLDAQRFRKIMLMTRSEREEVLFFAADDDCVAAIDATMKEQS